MTSPYVEALAEDSVNTARTMLEHAGLTGAEENEQVLATAAACFSTGMEAGLYMALNYPELGRTMLEAIRAHVHGAAVVEVYAELDEHQRVYSDIEKESQP